MSAWDTCPPDFGPARDAWLLQQIDDNNYSLDLVPIEASANGHTATFYVTGDLLMVEGIRVPVSAKLQQQVCDRLGLMMLTPRLVDMIHEQRGVTVLPLPRQITSKTAASIDQSARIDAAIAAAGGRPEGTAVSSAYKDWVLVKALASKPGRAANYGWIWGKEPTYQGLKGEPTVSLPGVRCIQGVGTVHDFSHQDYSQGFRAVQWPCLVDGNNADVRDVVRDADLAALISHEGPLPFDRHPGVDGSSQPLVDLATQQRNTASMAAATPAGMSGAKKAGIVAGIGVLSWLGARAILK